MANTTTHRKKEKEKEGKKKKKKKVLSISHDVCGEKEVSPPSSMEHLPNSQQLLHPFNPLQNLEGFGLVSNSFSTSPQFIETRFLNMSLWNVAVVHSCHLLKNKL